MSSDEAKTLSMITAHVRAAVNQTLDAAADLCNQMGDQEFARLMKKGSGGVATLTQRHYIRCAQAILLLKTGEKADD